MSQENVEVVRTYYERLGQVLEREQGASPSIPARTNRLAESVGDLFDPEAQWIPFFAPRGHKGGDDLLAAVDDWLEASDEWKVTPEEVRDAGGDQVFAIVLVSILGRGSRVPVEQRAFTVFTLRAGRIARIHDFLDRAEALEAVGLSE